MAAPPLRKNLEKYCNIYHELFGRACVSGCPLTRHSNVTAI